MKRIFNSDESLKSITDIIWIEISNILQNKMSPNNIYISIYHNRHGWQDSLREKCGFQKETSIVPYKKAEAEILSSSNTDEDNEKTIFNVIIPFTKYSDMIPCATRYMRKQNTRVYNVLKPYAWADIINDAFISQYHLPCNFIYKRARVNEDNTKAKHFINFQARCKDCKEDLCGWCDKKPNNFEPMEL